MTMNRGRAHQRAVARCCPTVAPVALAAALAAGGCTNPSDQLVIDDSAIGERSDPLWFNSQSVRWPVNGAFGLTSIRVCFDPSHPVPPEQQLRIRKLVEDNWERAAFIDFWGWQDCSGSLSNIVRVGIHPELANSGDQGLATVGWSRNGVNEVQFRLATPESHTILHEFGHTLGFVHEYTVCHSPRTGGAESLENEHDPLSVMNTPCVTVSTISAWDILGVRRKYGMKPRGSLAGLGGLCVNIAESSIAPNARIIGWPCSGQSNDTFFRTNGALTLQSFLANGFNRCVDIQNGAPSPTVATPVVSNGCNAALPNQQFSFNGVEWRAMGNRCIVPVSSGAGSHLILTGCGSNSRVWDFVNNKIRLNGTNLCVNTQATTGNAPPIGTEPVLADCRPFDHVQDTFGFFGGAILLDYDVELCFNVLGGLATNGSHIGIWNGCFAQPPIHNAQFSFHGAVTSMGQCLDLFEAKALDGVQLGVWQCHGGINQEWDYYW